MNLPSIYSDISSQPWLEPLFTNFAFGNSYGEYFFALLCIFGVALVANFLSYLLGRQGKRFTNLTKSGLDDVIVTIVHRSIVYLSVLAALYFSVMSLEFSLEVDQFFKKLVFVLFVLKIAKESRHLIEFIIEQYLEPYARKQKSLGSNIIPPLSRFTGFIIWSVAILLIVSNLGYNITSLITGLGLGGLAFALAAQEMLANTFGSISVLMDQAFKVGDFIKVEGVQGTVMEVGIRSTKIRTIEKNIISIPNKVVAATVIENVSVRNMFLVEYLLNVSYGSSSADIKALTLVLKKTLKKDKNVDVTSVRVHLHEFGDYSLKIKVTYYITDVSSYDRILDLKEQINLKLYTQIEKMGINIAFPTQTLHLHNEKIPKQTARRKKVSK